MQSEVYELQSENNVDESVKINPMLTRDSFNFSDGSSPETHSDSLNPMDFLKMTLNENGRLLGFELRVDMFPVAFEKDDFDFNIIQRALKTCIMINRLLKNGLSQDFNL